MQQDFIKIDKSGLPIFMDRTTGAITFTEGLEYQSRTRKSAGQMKEVFACEDIPEKEVVYEVYRGVSYPDHKEIFHNYDIRYDITVIHGGTIGGECKKTSGHYHGYSKTGEFTYPEVYEVLKGRIIFLFQKSIVPINKTQTFEPDIEEIYAIHAAEGETVIIPPFYGHCSINPTDEFAVFSNVAVTSCPIDYEIIQNKHGLAVKVVRKEETLCYINNMEYQTVPSLKHIKPDYASSLEIGKNIPCYMDFISCPDKYAFLNYPEKYMDELKIK